MNHFTWLTRLVYDGTDYLPQSRDILAKRVSEEAASTSAPEGGSDNNAAAKKRYKAAYALELMDTFGAYPDRIAHTKEYVPFFEGYGAERVTPEPIAIFSATDREAKMEAFQTENERYANGELPISEFLEKGKLDHATDIIESMWVDFGKRFYINPRNEGAVPNMADDPVLDTHELTDARAAMEELLEAERDILPAGWYGRPLKS